MFFINTIRKKLTSNRNMKWVGIRVQKKSVVLLLFCSAWKVKYFSSLKIMMIPNKQSIWSKQKYLKIESLFCLLILFLFFSLSVSWQSPSCFGNIMIERKQKRMRQNFFYMNCHTKMGKIRDKLDFRLNPYN